MFVVNGYTFRGSNSVVFTFASFLYRSQNLLSRSRVFPLTIKCQAKLQQTTLFTDTFRRKDGLIYYVNPLPSRGFT